MELNTATLSDFLKLADVIWQKSFDSVPQIVRSSGLFKINSIPANTGNTREFSEIDTEEYAKEKDEGDQATRAKVQQGYTKTITAKRVALDIGITYEMRTQNKYPEVTARLQGSARQPANRMDLDLSHRITFAASTSFVNMDGRTVSTTVGDGLALASTAHTLKGSSTTYRNILANNPRLSKGALEGIERLITEATFNQFGEKMTMPFDVLWTTDDPNTINTAREYLQSSADVEGAHSGIVNVYQTKYRHVVLPRIATTSTGGIDINKRFYWGVASTLMTTAQLAIWEEPRLKTPPTTDGTTGEDFPTDDWNLGVRGGYGIEIVSGAWFKISKGDGAA